MNQLNIVSTFILIGIIHDEFIVSVFNFRSQTPNNPPYLHNCTSKPCCIRRKKSCVQFSLPEAAASILVTSVAVGAAATLLAKRLKPSEAAAVHVSSIYLLKLFDTLFKAASSITEI